MHYVYILKSSKKDNWLYVGSTSDIDQRIKDHNFGKTRSTKSHIPLEIIHCEKHTSRELAYQRELFLKSGFGREEKYKITHSGIV